MGQTDEKTDASVHEELRQWRKLDDLERLRRRVHRAVRVAEKCMYAEEATLSERLKAVHALQQAASTHARMIEKGELEAEVEQLREELQAIKEQMNLKKVA